MALVTLAVLNIWWVNVAALTGACWQHGCMNPLHAPHPIDPRTAWPATRNSNTLALLAALVSWMLGASLWQRAKARQASVRAIKTGTR